MIDDLERAIEAMLFASDEALDARQVAARLGGETTPGAVRAIVAYHEPVSRAEIEAIRGVQTSKGTLDVLMEAEWIAPAGRREVPGRPLIYRTTDAFLQHFGLASRKDLPGIEDLRAAGLLDPVDLAFEAAMDELDLVKDGEDA